LELVPALLLAAVCYLLQALCLVPPVLLAQSTLLVDLLTLEVPVLSTWLVDPVPAGLVAVLFFRAALHPPLLVALFPFYLVLVNSRVGRLMLTLELCQAAKVVPFL
jgi:hypothetical protein